MQPIHATITTLNRLSEIISSINTQVITHLFIWTSYRQVKQKMALYKEFQSIHFMIKTDSSYTHTKNATRPWRLITISVGRGGGVANPPCRCTEQAGGGGMSGDAA
jgi:hypothetical protein